jgi:hypothetical protein
MNCVVSRGIPGRLAGVVLAAAMLANGTGRAEEAAPAAAEATPTYPSLDIIGFSDAGFTVTDAPAASSNSGFFQGQFVLHFTSALSSRVAFFGEVSLNAGTDAAYGAPGSAMPASAYHTSADVHRSVLKYTHGDHLKLSIGRFHTPVGYWNLAFHHGPWLQTTVARPRMLDFASPFLPLHIFGAFAEGEIPSGGVNLGYSIGLGNGRGSGAGSAEAPGDANNHRAWAVRISSKPDWLHGLELGGAHYADKLGIPAYGAVAAADYRESIWSGYIAFTKERPELIAEYASVRHRRADGARSYTSWAGYVQAAWRLPMLSAKLKPYVRWEEMRLRDRDPLFRGLPDGRGGLAGVRFDATDLLALKAEYHRRSEGAPFRNALLSQVSFTF